MLFWSAATSSTTTQAVASALAAWETARSQRVNSAMLHFIGPGAAHGNPAPRRSAEKET